VQDLSDFGHVDDGGGRSLQFDSVAEFINEVIRSSGPGGQVASGSNRLTAPAGFFERSDIGRGIYLSTAFGDRYRTVASVGAGAAPVSPIHTLTVSGAPTVQASGQIDWSVNTIPPLTLWRGGETVAAEVPVTMTNSHDPRGRLIRHGISASGSVTETTTYTVWDSFGRPTAATVVRPTSRSTDAVVYDDVARTRTKTSTTTSLTGGRVMTVSSTETFDWNGNSVRLEQRLPSGIATTTNEFHSMAVTCHGPVNPPAPPPDSGKPAPGYKPKGAMSASINGMRWTSTLGVQGSVTERAIGENARALILAVGGGDARYTLSVGVNVTHGPGTYSVAIEMPKDAREKPRGTANATLFDSTVKGGWQADPGSGSGSVTVTSVSAGGASGSFNLVLDPTPGTPASGRRTVAGEFNVTFGSPSPAKTGQAVRVRAQYSSTVTPGTRR